MCTKYFVSVVLTRLTWGKLVGKSSAFPKTGVVFGPGGKSLSLLPMVRSLRTRSVMSTTSVAPMEELDTLISGNEKLNKLGSVVFVISVVFRDVGKVRVRVMSEFFQSFVAQATSSSKEHISKLPSRHVVFDPVTTQQYCFFPFMSGSKRRSMHA